MNFIKQVIPTVFFLWFSSLTYGQSSPDQIVNGFFETFVKKGASEALDGLYETNPWVERNVDAVTKLKNEIEGLNEDFVGKYYGYELITEKKISDSFVLQSYIIRYDRQPIRFTFQFYKPNIEWRLFSFKYDANLDDELEESAKIYYLNYGE